MQHILKDALRESGAVDQKKLDECIRLEEETGQSLDKILLKKGYVSEDDILGVFSRSFGLPYLETLDDCKVPNDFVQKVPVQFARNHNLVAIGQENGTVRVATCAPLEINPMDDLASLLGAEVEPVLSSRSEIANLISRAYKAKADVVDEALGDFEDEDIVGLSKEIEESEDLLDMANKAPIIKLINMILFQALKMRASDIHLQPFEDRLQIRYRIDGILYDMEAPPKKVQEAIISRIKVMGKMDIAERRLPQDGSTSIRLGDSDVDIRLSSVPTLHGERIVMRLLDKGARLYDLEEIGFTERDMELFVKYIDYPNGILFVTGPTGSGKTTTLYSALKRINAAEINVMTIEDPIEYQLAGISQIQVSNKKGLTFASGLRSLLRQDPDVMMVGEVRDVETARIAIQAAQTGHLVFSTLHTNDAAGAITRMLDIGIEPYLVSSSVICVMAQRLVRLICQECREGIEPSEMDLKKMQEIGLDSKRLPGGRVWKGRGCEACFGTGFTGRTGIYEILPIDDLVRNQIMDRVGSNTIKKTAVERGMKTLRMDGIEKVIKGQTTLDEVMKVTLTDIF